MRTRFFVGALIVVIGSVAVAGAPDENAEPNAAPNAQAKPRRSCSKENPCPRGYDCLLDPDHEKGSFCEPSLFSKMACEQAEREKLIEARRKDVKWMRPVLSASLCWYARSRAAAVKEIATEKKYAQQGGGVVDMQRMYSLQNHMREMDHAAAVKKKVMAQLKVSPLPCTDRLVKSLMLCVREAPSMEEAKCDSESIRDYVELSTPYTEDE